MEWPLAELKEVEGLGHVPLLSEFFFENIPWNDEMDHLFVS